MTILWKVQADSFKPIPVMSNDSHLMDWPPACFAALKLDSPKPQFGNHLKHIDIGNIMKPLQSDEIVDQKRTCSLLLCSAVQKMSNDEYKHILLSLIVTSIDGSRGNPAHCIDDGGF